MSNFVEVLATAFSFGQDFVPQHEKMPHHQDASPIREIIRKIVADIDLSKLDLSNLNKTDISYLPAMDCLFRRRGLLIMFILRTKKTLVLKQILSQAKSANEKEFLVQYLRTQLLTLQKSIAQSLTQLDKI